MKVLFQELDAEEERLWEEQVQAARSRAGSEGERYRRHREVRSYLLLVAAHPSHGFFFF